MVVNAAKRQKQLAAKKAKRKNKLAQRLLNSATMNHLTEIERMARWPILDCLVPDQLWADGIGAVCLMRCAPSGEVGFATFLLDVQCRGVKDAFFGLATERRIRERLANTGQTHSTVEPAYLRKLIEDAAAYAADLGISPHPDYALTKVLFGDISAESCSTSFTFGTQGKPLFISGPNDSAAKVEKICATLDQRCGPGKWDYVLAATDSVATSEEADDFAEEPLSDTEEG